MSNLLCLRRSLIAMIAIMMLPMACAAMNDQTNESDGARLIGEATRANENLFRIYVIALAVTALLVAYLTFALRRSDTKVQELVKADADARIATADAAAKEAQGVAAKANDGAATANHRATDLENANLVLRRNIADLENARLALETNLTNLKIELAAAKTKQAEAEKALWKYVSWRDLDRKTVVDELKGKPKARVELLFESENTEAFHLAILLSSILGADEANGGSGWPILSIRAISEADAIHKNLSETDVPLSIRAGGWPQGVVLIVKFIPPAGSDKEVIPAAAGALEKALSKSGHNVGMVINPSLPDDVVRVIISSKE